MKRRTEAEGAAHCTCNNEVLKEALQLTETSPIGFRGWPGSNGISPHSAQNTAVMENLYIWWLVDS